MATIPPIDAPRRRRVLVLVAFGLLLASPDGARPLHPPGAVSSPPTDRSAEPEAVFAELARMNPALPEHEVRRIGDAVLRYSRKYELDVDLVLAVIDQESSGRPEVRSPKGAMGLMQVMPHMQSALGLVGNAATIETNIEAGCLILADNIRRLGERDGILAYFWGSSIRGTAYYEEVNATRAALRRRLDL